MRSGKEYCILGVMSGTSLDGIDLAIVRWKHRPAAYELLHATTLPYPRDWVQRLSTAKDLSATDRAALDISYTQYLGDTLAGYLDQHPDHTIDFISSHGHTVLHQPEKGITHQIGNLPVLATITRHPVVCDFRVADVALGGQGAPLVPAGERDLFSSYAACVNLGGFANITQLHGPYPVAFDICAVNTVLNGLAQRLGMDFDAEGALARSGKLLPVLLQTLDQLAFYQKHPPKSLGVEWIQQFIQPIFASVKHNTTEDILHTYCLHIAKQIGRCLPQGEKVLFTGGGCYNRFLMEQIGQFSKATIELPSKAVIEYKEAIVFAYLGLLRWEERPNCLSSVTGADHDHSSGNIFFPQQ